MRRGPDLDVTGYLSYRRYLQEWFDAQKAADARYSHRHFARRAGVKSPSLLKEVIAGRRNLTPVTTNGFLNALRLEAEDADFFRALVQLDQATTHEEKNEAWLLVASCRRFRAARAKEVDFVRYLSSWIHPAVRELALTRGFRADAQWIACALRPRISADQAQESLDLLFELGMLRREGGRVVPVDVSLATPHEVAFMTVANYHQQMIARAADAIHTVDAAERHLLALTVAVPEDLVPRLKTELDAFQERLLHICDDAATPQEDGQPAAERVYQINLQLVPLSGGSEC